MSETLTLPAPVFPSIGPLQTKWQREFAAFQDLLPQLMVTHAGKFVAIHGQQLVDSGNDKVALALRVLGKLGNIDIHIGLVTAQPAVIAHSGVRREVRGGEA